MEGEGGMDLTNAERLGQGSRVRLQKDQYLSVAFVGSGNTDTAQLTSYYLPTSSSRYTRRASTHHAAQVWRRRRDSIFLTSKRHPLIIKRSTGEHCLSVLPNPYFLNASPEWHLVTPSFNTIRLIETRREASSE